MKILAIETSCDETAAAVVEDGTKIVSNVVASSKDMHEKYGGIVPEIAAREQLTCIIPVIEEALSIYSSSLSARSHTDGSRFHSNNIKNIIDENIDAIAMTVGPGLIGSLLVGVETAKTIAFVTGKPIIPVNHVIAHMYANFVNSQQSTINNQRKKRRVIQQLSNHELVKFPAISLVVSGGHTELYIMKSLKDLVWLGGTLDDAAGECFDKTARLLGFGNGGGVAIQEASLSFKHQASSIKHQASDSKGQIILPRPMMKDASFNFSFSGLKTAVLREVNKLKTNQQFNTMTIQQLGFEVQEAITDVLVEKTVRAAKQCGAKSILLSGGVAANLRLREKFLEAISRQSSAVSFFAPPKELCTDNAVMIAASAFFTGTPTGWHEITAVPDLQEER